MIMQKKVLTILTIDDDRSCQLTVARYFTLVGGHMVLAAGSGREGIQKAESSRPDIILLDMRMPDMNGLAVTEELAAAPDTGDIPVILLTGSEIDKETLAAFRRCGNFMWLEPKPARLSDLLAKIERRLAPPLTDTAKDGFCGNQDGEQRLASQS